MKLTLLILLGTIPLQSHALFQKVYKGYKDSNRLKLLEMNTKINENNGKLGLSVYDWKLQFSGNYRDSGLASLSSFQSQKTVTTTYGVGLVKDTFKYGTFEINHSQTKYDLSDWTSNPLASFNSDYVFEGRSTLKYTYELLNDAKALNFDKIQIETAANDLKTKAEIEKDSFDFYQAYLKAKLNVLLDRLYAESKLRAQKRVNLIKRRLKDGLSLKSDVLQARLSYETQNEIVLSNVVSLRESLIILENILGFKIEKAHYKSLVWTQKKSKSFEYLFGQVENAQSKYQERAVELQLMNDSIYDENSKQNLNFSLSYTKNAFDDERPKAIKDATTSGDKDEKVLSVNYTIPLGVNKSSLLESKKKLSRQQAKLSILDYKNSINVQVESLKENLERVEQALVIAERKEKIAKLFVKEKQDLYLRGQSRFDEVISAEESYIQTRINKVQKLSAFEHRLGQLAYLTGKIENYLREYVD